MQLIEKILGSKILQVITLLVGVATVVELVDVTVSSTSLWIRGAAILALTLIIILIGIILLDMVQQRITNRIAATVVSEMQKTGVLDQVAETAARTQADAVLDRVAEGVRAGLSEIAGAQRSTQQPSLSCEHESAYIYSAERYGIGYDRLEVEVSLRNDGSARVTRGVLVAACSQIDKLDTFLLIPESAPEGVEWYIDRVEVRSLTPGRSVHFDSSNVSKVEGRLSTLIQISPPLIERQTVDYQLVEELPAKLYAIDLTDAEAAKRKKPYDYFGWTINRPTRKLQLRIYFPEGLKPEQCGLEVRYASAAPGIPSENFQLEEQGRLQEPSLDGPEGGRYSLKLDVDYPMIGLVYVLRWQPLQSSTRKRSLRPRASASSLPPAGPARGTAYNSAAIRDLIQNAFDARELGQFCQDRELLRPVVVRFGADASLWDMADTLLDFCQKRNLVAELLSEIKAFNPSQYAGYEASLTGSESTEDKNATDAA